MKLNFRVRFKHPMFYIGIASVALSAIGVDFSTLTDWQLLHQAVLDVLNNPFQLVTLIMAVAAVINDPTTAGLMDSTQAMQYISPAKED